MKTIFDKTTREELIRRIDALNENSVRQWGKMTVYQMVKHCSLWEEMALGKTKYKRAFLGRLFGKIALRDMLGKDKPMPRNAPTISELKITTNGDAEVQKNKWISLIQEYENFSNFEFVHPFFGKIDQTTTGRLAYNHIDHHLRQFNC